MEDLEKNKLGTIYCSAGAGLADSDWPVGRNRVRTATSISVKGQYMGLPFSKIPALGILAALLLSCASTNLSPIHESRSSFSREEDEKKLWGEAESLEKELAKSGLLYNDPELDVYLNSVFQEANGDASKVAKDYECSFPLPAYPSKSHGLHPRFLYSLHEWNSCAFGSCWR